MASTNRKSGRLVLNLALQGGGAHGAFTWGALDRLLEEEDIDIGRISGTSAGALNGAALATGYAMDGRAGAKANLALLWRKVSEAGAPMTFLLLPLRKPGMGVWDDAMPLLSPYQTNPLALEPLRYILSTVADIDVMKRPEAPRLFVNAVNVHSGYSRVFGPQDMSLDAILASACAPLMFQAAQIDGDSYWDGSYAGNPMLWAPLRGRSGLRHSDGGAHTAASSGNAHHSEEHLEPHQRNCVDLWDRVGNARRRSGKSGPLPYGDTYARV